MTAETASLDAVGVAWRLGVTLLLVVVNGFFVAAEFALVKVKRTRIVELAEHGRLAARVSRHLLDHLDRYLSACQLGITLASLVLGALGEPAVGAVISGGLDLVGVEVERGTGWLRWVSLITAFTAITVMHMTLGEQAPKMWALRHAQSATLLVALPLRAFTVVFAPFIGFINATSNALLRLVGISPDHGHEAVPTLGELRRAISLSAEAGHISEHGRELAENVLRTLDMQVRHVLVPRVDVAQLSLEDSLEKILEEMTRSGHSRYPLCEDDLDTIVGIVHVRDVFGRGRSPTSKQELRGLARPAAIVPETTPLGNFIGAMQASGSHAAAVVDEYGSVLGLAFLEDGLEEIVGPIADEFDDKTPPVVDKGEGQWEVSGSLPLPDLVDRFDLSIADTGSSSLGGYFTSVLGRLPRKGDEIEIGAYRMRVASMARGRAVQRVLVRRVQEEEPGVAVAAGDVERPGDGADEPG